MQWIVEVQTPPSYVISYVNNSVIVEVVAKPDRVIEVFRAGPPGPMLDDIASDPLSYYILAKA